MKPKHLLLLCCLLGFLNTNAQRPFITTWNTINAGVTNSTHILFYAIGDNFQVNWVNMSNAADTGNTVGIKGANTISFAVPGIYKVYITPGNGSFSAITLYNNDINDKGDGKKLLSIEQWGDINWSTFNRAFANCDSMVMNAPDIPKLSNVTDLYAMFYSCQSLTTNAAMNDWDASNVTDMQLMFFGASSFNQPIGNWDVSNVTNMAGMFFGASSFNQPIGNWNVSNVTDMVSMFWNAHNFNQPIGNWDVSNVRNMGTMFNAAYNFNQPIGNWNVSNVTNMAAMFNAASSFNQSIGNWNVGNVTNMVSMFWNAHNFNQPIGNWNVSNVRNMAIMFSAAYNFNQPIGNWDVGSATDMSLMFMYAYNFNQPIGNWNVNNVEDMHEMFLKASSFNQSLNNWKLNSLNNEVLFYGGRSMLDSCGMDCDNYSETLRGWAANNALQQNVTLGAANLIYDSAVAKAAHDSLTNIKGWTIIGDAMGHCSVLPVNFLSFSANKQGKAALLNWSVGNEINNKGYDVEKSSNMSSFNSIAFIAAKSAQKQTAYTYTDKNLVSGITYYRIKEIDNDGKFMYSNVQKIEFSNFAWKINGNPVNNSFIELMLDKPANVLITILSSNGNIIKILKKGNLSIGSYNIPLNIDDVSAGLYIVKLMVDGRAYTSAVIKQ